MNKKTFLNDFKKELKYYKKINSEEIIYYYDEMIQDAIDEGQDEETFIGNLGSISSIIANIIQDEGFVKDVKTANIDSLGNIVSGTVKVMSLIIYYFVVVILAIIFGSIFFSGFGMVIQSILYLIFDQPTQTDLWVIVGVILMGIGIMILSFGLIYKTFKANDSIRLKIIRKTKEVYRKRSEK
jgi:uncharacterized membrane protein